MREDTIAPGERLVRRFVDFTNEYPWNWAPSHVDEWTQSLTGESHLAPSTIRGYQTDLRLFSEYLTDGRYRWAVECEKAFGTAKINARFVAYRDALRLPKTLTRHSLRHSWVTHLTEDGVDRRFIRKPLGTAATPLPRSTPTCPGTS